jgi:murein DD-endopeptidase MepM/ murein hydrolase activator NlpD
MVLIATASATGRGVAQLIWPVEGVITSPFGYRSPLIGGSNIHWGIDIAAPEKTVIVSAVSGKIKNLGWHPVYGYTVIVEHGPFVFIYAHCSEILVSKDTVLRQGDVIARVGATGRATGPHLHFEIRYNGHPFDPMQMLPEPKF